MMTDENKNIDSFFSARLQNETNENDDWNMPSDDIWNAAKPKFVNRKKPKKRFVFWLLIPVLAFCVCVPLKLIEGVSSSSEGIEFTKLANNQIEKQESNIRSIESGQNIADVQSLPGINPIEEPIKKEDLLGNDALGLNGSSARLKPDFKSRDNIESRNNEGPIAIKGNVENIQLIDEDILRTEKEIMEAVELNEEIDVVNFKNDSEPANLEIAALVPILDSRLISISKGRLNIKHPNIDIRQPNLILPVAKPIYRNEIGISHSELLLNLIFELDEPSENGIDEFKLSQNYFNANITGRKWLNKRWSFMTGIQYSNLDLDINFSVSDTLDRELMQFLNEEFNDITSRSTVGDQDVDFVIDLKDGVDVELGNVLNIHGAFSQRIRAIQIPFFLDYHIYKRKMEYIFGLGVTLEYIMVSENPSDFKIYRDSKLISKPVDLPLFSERFIDGSIYVKSGMRYLLSDQFSIGLDAKINLLGLPFSGLDVGIYYRWN